MKNVVIFLCFCLFFLNGYTQTWGEITFDDSYNLYRIKIDTSNPTNIWQIGKPDKQVFKSAYSVPNAIVTDSVNPYPINNNSIFDLGIQIPDLPAFLDFIGIDFYYKMDSDTITDFGEIQYSQDTGKTWMNLLNSATYQVRDSSENLIASNGMGSPIVFTGRSNGWYYFSAELSGIGFYNDTIIYRFTFHSDGIQTYKDGWMIDNIEWYSLWEGITEKKSNCKIFPNPATDNITVELSGTVKENNLVIFDIEGQRRITCPITQTKTTIDICNLPSGVYFVRVTNDRTVGVKKIIKQ
jgi:hypothetical protein